jgi:hypothetical protein
MAFCCRSVAQKKYRLIQFVEAIVKIGKIIGHKSRIHVALQLLMMSRIGRRACVRDELAMTSRGNEGSRKVVLGKMMGWKFMI